MELILDYDENMHRKIWSIMLTRVQSHARDRLLDCMGLARIDNDPHDFFLCTIKSIEQNETLTSNLHVVDARKWMLARLRYGI